MIYSRTCKDTDYYELEIDDLIKEYLYTEKRYINYKNSRYKFWEYALTIKLIEELGIKDVVDISLYKFDNCYDTLLKNRNINLTQYSLEEFNKLNIRYHRFLFLTCFGVLDYLVKPYKTSNKMARHLEIGGLMLLTNEDTLSTKSIIRKSVITPEHLLRLSLMIENEGFDIYPTNVIDRVDYDEDSDMLSSIVIQRVGR